MRSIRTLVALAGVAASLSVAACGSPDRVDVLPAEVERHSAILAQYAAQNGLTGLSPASLTRVEVCHGLSLASAMYCSSDELVAALGADARP